MRTEPSSGEPRVTHLMAKAKETFNFQFFFMGLGGARVGLGGGGGRARACADFNHMEILFLYLRNNHQIWLLKRT